MKGKCKGCGKEFDRHLIVVTQEGLFCEGCLPDGAINHPFTFHFSWRGINALMDYIDGERNLEVLEIIEVLRPAMSKKIAKQIREVLGGEISESDS